jgi:hypothetical protein
MPGQGISKGCPTNAMLRVAENLVIELLDTNKINKDDAQKALGGIALSRRSLELVANETDCPGQCVTQQGQLDCPLRDQAFAVRSFAAQPWDSNKFAVSLPAIVSESTAARTGQYL